MKQKTKQSGGFSRRLHFPDDEKRQAWLALLPDAYSISDTGVATTARNSEEKKKRKICLRPEGVAVGCHQKTVCVISRRMQRLKRQRAARRRDDGKSL